MRPLSGLTVIDLCVNVPGPFCSSILGDLGARVVGVEPPGGDPLRHSPGMWASLNGGKQSLVLDLKSTEGRDVLAALVRRADVVLEGWRPGVASRLGADCETLWAVNPALVYCSISGFGQDGPWRDRPAHDLNYLALSGYLGVQAAMDGAPTPPPVLVSDLVSGLYAAIAVLAALAGRAASGKGAYIDLSMTEAALALLGPELGRLQDGGDPAHPNVTSIPHYGLFPTADGRWVSLGIVHEDHFWRRLCEAAGLAEMADMVFEQRTRCADQVQDALHRTFSDRSAAEWEDALGDADIPFAVVAGLEEALSSPQMRWRQVAAGSGAAQLLRLPALFSTGDVSPRTDAPALGEHSSALLAELGYDSAEVGRMREQGALGRPVGASHS